MAKKITKKERKALKALERNINNKHNIKNGIVTPATDVIVKELANNEYTVDGIDLFFTEMPSPAVLAHIQSFLIDEKGFGMGKMKSFDIQRYGDNKGYTATWMTESPVQDFKTVDGIMRLRDIFRDTPQYDGCEFYCRTAEIQKFEEQFNNLAV